MATLDLDALPFPAWHAAADGVRLPTDDEWEPGGPPVPA
jgi:hypothetical protein